jgi:3-methylcrotonyl-CoA carboxylase alpha subunit
LPSLANRVVATRSFSSSIDLDKVLVANRGEIACRVLRTCKQMGIPTVALYSVADGPEALHARMADESYLIGTGPSPADSYLLQDEVLKIAQQSGACAIHPGYGFLSENANFANQVEEASIAFVGPPASAITAMGSKSQSKAIMEAAGMKCIILVEFQHLKNETLVVWLR